MAIRNTFKLYERLKREQHIDTLFRTGKAFSVLPLRIIYVLQPRNAEPSPARAGFSVPKKRFRKSVQRHRVRRLMVEAWRLNKHSLYAAIPAEHQLHLFIIYTGHEELLYSQIEEAMKKAVEKLTGIYTAQ